MKSFIKVMKALSDPTRIRIIKMLQHRSMCVCEMQAALQVAQPTVSNHLKLLGDAGLVYSHKDGLWVNYFLSDGSNSPYAASIIGNLRHWLEDDPQVVALTEKIPLIQREALSRKKGENVFKGCNGDKGSE